MIVQYFHKFHNKQAVQLGIQQIDWTLHFQTQTHRVSVPTQFGK
jgi:hypothetical protein